MYHFNPPHSRHRNPDEKLRRLERIYAQTGSIEDYFIVKHYALRLGELDKVQALTDDLVQSFIDSETLKTLPLDIQVHACLHHFSLKVRMDMYQTLGSYYKSIQDDSERTEQFSSYAMSKCVEVLEAINARQPYPLDPRRLEPRWKDPRSRISTSISYLDGFWAVTNQRYGQEATIEYFSTSSSGLDVLSPTAALWYLSSYTWIIPSPKGLSFDEAALRLSWGLYTAEEEEEKEALIEGLYEFLMPFFEESYNIRGDLSGGDMRLLSLISVDEGNDGLLSLRTPYESDEENRPYITNHSLPLESLHLEYLRRLYLMFTNLPIYAGLGPGLGGARILIGN